MTEDEAFIRTIVDSPGDDLPRLVYADWLDERADPRGAYLRAEAEWAKAKQTTGFLLLRLNGLADGLDPVWVARVSRPPVGVCVEHVRFTECGPMLDVGELDLVQSRLGLLFPSQLRAFLLNQNGGTPDPACLPYPASRGWGHKGMEIGRLYTASRRAWPPPSNSSSNWDYEIEGARDFLSTVFEPANPLLSGLVPIASTPRVLGELLIGCDGKRNGQIFHFLEHHEAMDDPTLLTEYVDSLAHLLSVLRPDQPAH